MKLYTKSQVKAADSVKQRHKAHEKGVATSLLHRASIAWENLRRVREQRQRVIDYCYGDQWGDVIEYKDEKMTEREYIRRRGDVALTNNIMVSILNTVVGLYAKQQTEPVCFARTDDAQPLSDVMSATMQQNWQDTNMPQVLKTVFEDALLGGVMAVRETFEQRDEAVDTWTDYVNPNYIFWEAGTDPRMKDLRLVGMLHDVGVTELYRIFANKKYGWTTGQLDQIFGIVNGEHPFNDYDATGIEQNDRNRQQFISFEHPSDHRLLRVVEVWTKETKRRLQCQDPIATNADDAFFKVELSQKKYIDGINTKRVEMYVKAGIPIEEVPLITYEEMQDEYWYYTYLAPDGTVLCEGESPYDFHSHPFTIKLFPYVNGEVHSFMGNIVDQQRYINRLIVMHDMAARSAAKGITIVPISCIPDNMTPADFADQFTSYDGLIFYDTARQNPNLRPEIITSNAVQIGTTELLNMEMNLVRDITNVSGAIQGKTPSSGTSAARYSMETQNSTTALYTVFADMTSFTENLARKKCAMIKQYYPDRKYVFNKDMTGVVLFNRLSVEDVMFKIAVKEAAATASYQMQINDTLEKLLQMGLIDIVQYLQNVKLPYADSLLQQIQSRQAQEQALLQEQAEQGYFPAQQAASGQEQSPQGQPSSQAQSPSQEAGAPSAIVTGGTAGAPEGLSLRQRSLLPPTQYLPI